VGTVRDQEIHEARVLGMAERVERELDLGWLKITHKFSTRADERVAAEAFPDWEYRQASILWQLCVVATITDEELHATMIHEVVHCLTAPLWNSLPTLAKHFDRLNELATENVTRAILAALTVE
jgi:hypothetical protein